MFGYVWARPGGSAPLAETGYALHFEPWDWFIVTGVYMDDVQHAFYVDLGL
jgi:methyl-accepting chemotaxis protein